MRDVQRRAIIFAVDVDPALVGDFPSGDTCSWTWPVRARGRGRDVVSGVDTMRGMIASLVPRGDLHAPGAVFGADLYRFEKD